MTNYMMLMINIEGILVVMTNKGRFCNNSEIDTLISKGLSLENKAKQSQLEIVNKQYCGGGVSSFQLREFRSALYRQSL